MITEHEMERDKLLRELHSAEARLKIGEKSKEDLTEEFTTLKKNYLALTGAHDKEQAQSKELTAELLALAKAHDELLRKLEEHHGRVQSATQDLHGELDRVRALISSMSHKTVEVRQCVGYNTRGTLKERSTLKSELIHRKKSTCWFTPQTS